jgi:hypothetical protein
VIKHDLSVTLFTYFPLSSSPISSLSVSPVLYLFLCFAPYSLSTVFSYPLFLYTQPSDVYPFCLSLALLSRYSWSFLFSVLFPSVLFPVLSLSVHCALLPIPNPCLLTVLCSVLCSLSSASLFTVLCCLSSVPLFTVLCCLSSVTLFTVLCCLSTVPLYNVLCSLPSASLSTVLRCLSSITLFTVLCSLCSAAYIQSHCPLCFAPCHQPLCPLCSTAYPQSLGSTCSVHCAMLPILSISLHCALFTLHDPLHCILSYFPSPSRAVTYHPVRFSILFSLSLYALPFSISYAPVSS